jgi:AcrR family transcriptional regulator
MPDQVLLSSRRERGKDGRRARIVEATCAMMREFDLADLSVKMIADRADVSPATVYNLFGTKGAILVRVYERDLEDFEQRVSRARSADALEAIFDAIDIAVDRYRDDARFYRAALSTRNGGLDQPMVAAAHRPRVEFWRALAARAIAEGRLRAEVDAGRLAVLLIQISGGALGRWVSNLIAVDELHLETSYGVAVVLLAFAAAAERPRLQARLTALERALAELDRRNELGALQADT